MKAINKTILKCSGDFLKLLKHSPPPLLSKCPNVYITNKHSKHQKIKSISLKQNNISILEREKK